MGLIDQNKDQLGRLLQDLIRFPSVNPPGNEEPIARFLDEKLKNLSFTTELVEMDKGRPNVIAKLSGTTGRPRLLCYSHTDVVPPGDLEDWSEDPFSGKIDGDKIWGRGSQDHKFAIPVLMTAIKAIQDVGLRLKGDLIFAFVVDEEMGGHKGFRPLLEKGYFVDTDAMIYGATGALDGKWIYIGSNGARWYRITVLGKSVHTSKLEKGCNAIVKAAMLVLALQELADKVNRKVHSHTGSARMSVNMVRGGEKENVVPGRCIVTVDRRVTPAEDYEEVTGEIQTVLNRLKQEDPEFRFQMEVTDGPPPVEGQPDSEIVKVLQDAGEAILGVRPKVRGTSGSSDRAWYASMLKKPIAFYAITKAPPLAHAANEYAFISDLVNTTKAYAITFIRYLGVEEEYR